MAISRAALLALLGGVLALGAFLVTQNTAAEEEVPPGPPLSAEAGAGRSKGAPPGASPTRGASASDTAKSALGRGRPEGGTRSRQRNAALPRPARRAFRAVTKRQVVVLFFSKRGPADDTATRRAVRSLDALRGRATVVTDRIEHLEAYRRTVGDIGISQPPAVVVVGRDRKVRLLEGYVDAASLRQYVLDARR